MISNLHSYLSVNFGTPPATALLRPVKVHQRVRKFTTKLPKLAKMCQNIAFLALKGTSALKKKVHYHG